MRTAGVRDRARVLPFALLAILPATRAAAQDETGPRYGDAGTAEVSILLGASSDGFAVGGGFRYFVMDAVAPGVEASIERTHGFTQGFTFASVRVVPLRLASFALVATARGGHVFLSDHADGWAVGGDVGVLMMLSPHAGLELGYEVLKLLPASFCADFEGGCVLQRPVIGLRITF
jgi:hypothetical protein